MGKTTIDSYKHQGLRKQLMNELTNHGFDHKVIEAMNAIPRHFFLDSAFASHAYEDKAFSIGEGQTISQPYTVAYQTQMLELQPGQKVLEIGTGSGYQAAVLAKLGAKVYSIERIAKLSQSASKLLNYLACPAYLMVGDGTLGWESEAPFHKIIITAAAPHAPQHLLNQLGIGGWMVIPIGDIKNQIMTKIVRHSEIDFESISFDSFKFVPLIGQHGW
ncbi:MAG: protein-L-isoaspartate(D-aspartate) O-methyltransferase [Bacteroidota bacterium]|nr:protein-L-isoaspartate(D-aspartate) O-methyltransferase [Bacteroidota bacterium]